MRLEGRYLQGEPLISNNMFGTAKAASDFAIVHRPEEPDFPCGPAPWTGWQRNSQTLAFGNDVLDEPASASRKDGVGNFAKMLHFGRRPVGRATGHLLLGRQFNAVITK